MADFFENPGRCRAALFRFVLCLGWMAAPSAWAQAPAGPPMQQLLQLARIEQADAAPDPAQLAASPTRARRLGLYRELMARPALAPYRAGLLADACREAASSPYDLMRLAGAVADLPLERSASSTLKVVEDELRAAADPLAAGIAWMGPMASPGNPWPPALPVGGSSPSALRFELAMVLATMGRAHLLLERSLKRVPASVTPALLRRQAVEGRFEKPDEPDFRRLLRELDREALLAGILDLVAAVQRLRDYVAAAPALPRLAWRIDTPMGTVVVDTTGRDNVHVLRDPLLVLDVGGNDRHEFHARNAARRITVLLDHGGDDRYVARDDGADPSAAVLGYAILWDTEGDDRYRGSQLSQAAALFGASLLVDGGGTNEFIAGGHSQAHAVGGLALLLGGPGNDSFNSQTHAQGSAGPEGVAMLVDAAGDDRYVLDNEPLTRPSSQLPDRNTSMGQGAGRGIRADQDGGGSTAGGIGVLVDLGGDDQYSAQVFAQGAGFEEGLGLLVDDGGNDRFDAAWYAMGAAAHRGAGVLIKRGVGHDRYRASHSISIGAAHDLSVGFFLDEGGDDGYRVGDLGLGAAHDNSAAFFVDVSGDDAYRVESGACRALGVAWISEWNALRERLPNAGFFMDLAGDDAYPAQCAQARNDAGWAGPRTRPAQSLRSEAGAGIDGHFASPFATRRPSTPGPRR
jgi:hypothetical protein